MSPQTVLQAVHEPQKTMPTKNTSFLTLERRTHICDMTAVFKTSNSEQVSKVDIQGDKSL